MRQVTTIQAAAALGITRQAVQTMISKGTIRATRVGRDWLIPERELARAANRPGRGRPKESERGQVAMKRTQSIKTVRKHLQAMLSRFKDEDFTSIPEDRALQAAVKLLRKIEKG